MAYLVGVGLLVLVCVGVPLQYAAGKPAVVSVVGPIHGFLYIVYLLTVADLARRFRLSLGQVIALVAAGIRAVFGLCRRAFDDEADREGRCESLRRAARPAPAGARSGKRDGSDLAWSPGRSSSPAVMVHGGAGDFGRYVSEPDLARLERRPVLRPSRPPGRCSRVADRHWTQSWRPSPAWSASGEFNAGRGAVATSSGHGRDRCGGHGRGVR